MELVYVLYIYIILVIIIILVCCKYAINPLSAVAIGLIIGFIFVNIIYPPNYVDPEKENGSVYALYILIQFATFLLLLIYSLIMAFNDIKCCDISLNSLKKCELTKCDLKNMNKNSYISYQ